VLEALPPSRHPDLIVGFEHASDAAVYRIDDHRALVQTVDFFTPVVDDPRSFGRIAAANALSDCYAMGGTPITALAIVCFPEGELGTDVLVELLEGGDEKVREAGALVVGGHSVKDRELKYGLSVTGIVEVARVRTNALARAGDVLVLTKPLGTGLIANAIKAGSLAPTDPIVLEATRSMEALNASASAVLSRHGIRGSTDVTGFGLVGHALSFAEASGVGFTIRTGALPALPGALDLARRPLAGGARDNEEHAASRVDRASGVDDRRARLAFDAQTSGGLLAAVPADRVDALVRDLEAAGTLAQAVIGEVTADGAGRIRLLP
jgi:selenide,water dikinase